MKRPVIERQVHRRDVLVGQDDSVVGEIEFMPVAQKRLEVELSVKTITTVSDHGARSRRYFSSGIDQMNCKGWRCQLFRVAFTGRPSLAL